MNEEILKMFEDVSRVLQGIEERVRETEHRLNEVKESIKGKEV